MDCWLGSSTTTRGGSDPYTLVWFIPVLRQPALRPMRGVFEPNEGIALAEFNQIRSSENSILGWMTIEEWIPYLSS